MTIAALHRLLDEIDTQGGPDAARHLRPMPPALRYDAIAALLRTGATYREVRQQLGGGSPNDFVAVRRAENIPVPQRPVPSRTPEETYALYAESYGNGHARWTGGWAGRMPQIQHPGRDGRKESALRVAFRWRHGREPTGYVRPGCGVSDCVASGHLTDRDMRQALNRPRSARQDGAQPS